MDDKRKGLCSSSYFGRSTTRKGPITAPAPNASKESKNVKSETVAKVVPVELAGAPEPQLQSFRRVVKRTPLAPTSIASFSSGDTEESQYTDSDGDDIFGDAAHSESWQSTVKVKRTKSGRFVRYVECSSSVGDRENWKENKDKSWIINSECPGGPEVPDVIPSFGGHIAHVLWSNLGADRGVLTGYQKSLNLAAQLIRCPLDAKAQSLVAGSKHQHLGGCMMKNLNMPLLSAFVERWQPDTNTFHMPFGEMSILLHDVECILGIPIEGNVCKLSEHMEDTEDTDSSGIAYLCVFFGRSEADLKLPFNKGVSAPIYKGGTVLVDAVKYAMQTTGFSEEQAQGYLFLLLGMSLFVEESNDRANAECYDVPNVG
ncbi:hypothetical protein vseg_020433 [Gypsophila vaccaria]